MKYTHDTRANKKEEDRITIQVKKRAIHDDTKYWGKTDPTFGGNRPPIQLPHATEAVALLPILLRERPHSTLVTTLLGT